MSNIIKGGRVKKESVIKIGDSHIQAIETKDDKITFEESALNGTEKSELPNNTNIIESEPKYNYDAKLEIKKMEEEKNAIIKKANEEAQKIIEQAKLNLDNSEKKISEEREKLEKEKTEADAYVKSIKEEADNYKANIKEIADQEKLKILANIEDDIIKLICELLEFIIEDQLDTTVQWINYIVKRILKKHNIISDIEIGLSTKVFLMLSQEDIEQLEAISKGITVVERPDIEDYSVIVGTENGDIVYDVQESLEKVQSDLKLIKKIGDNYD